MFPILDIHIKIDQNGKKLNYRACLNSEQGRNEIVRILLDRSTVTIHGYFIRSSPTSNKAHKPTTEVSELNPHNH